MLRLKGAKGISHFQQAHGLKATGHLDKATSGKLRLHNQNARAKSSPSPRKAPVDPLQRAANQQANLEFAPQINTQKGLIAGSKQQLLNTDAWYQDYVNKVDAAKQQAADAYSNAENMLIRQASNSDTADRASNQQLASQMQADAASRGATVDPNVQAQGNQAASARQAAISTLLANIGIQGANASTAMAERGAVAQGAKANALTAETNRGQNLKLQLGQLKTQRGQRATTDLSALQKAQLDQQIAEQGLGIKVGQLNVNKQNAATSRLAAKSLTSNRKTTAKLQSKKLHEAIRHDKAGEATQHEKNLIAQYKATHPASRSGSKSTKKSQFTPTQIRSARKEFRASVNAVRNGPKIPVDQAAAELVKPSGPTKDPLVALAAAQLAVNGGVTSKVARQMHSAYGIHVRVAKISKNKGIGGAVNALGGVLQGLNG